MQDGTQEGNEAYVISHRGARSRGYKRRERERARERERERELGLPACLPLCIRMSLSPRPRIVSTSPRVNVRQCERFLPLPPSLPRKAMDTPFYRYKEMPSCTMGCSYVLTWLAEKRLEPYTRANVAVGEVP
jgi:hypothetical protein